MTQTLTESGYTSEHIAQTGQFAQMATPHSGEKAALPVGERLHDHWSATVRDVRQIGHQSVEYSRSALHAADEYVRNNPWKAVGAAAGAGALVSWLLARR